MTKLPIVIAALVWAGLLPAALHLAAFHLSTLQSPLLAQATNPFEQNFDAQLVSLKDRISFYQTSFPNLVIPDDLQPAQLAALQASSGSPQAAQRKLIAVITKLDRSVLAFLKREIHQAGSHIGTDTTNRSNFERRRFMILDFVAVLKRQRIPLMVYFPKGEKELMMLQMGGEEAFRVTDALMAQLAGKLRDDVGATKAAGGGDSGGGGGSGGLSGTQPDGVTNTGGGLSGFEEPAPSAAPPPRPRQPPPAESETSWIGMFKLIVGTGVVAVVLCSLLALLLPRVRAGMFSLLRQLGGKGEDTSAPLEEDLLKKGLLALNRGDYKRGLSFFEKVKSPMKAPEVVYHRALCHIRLLESEAAGHQLAMIELDRTSVDEVFRLGLACEESRMLEWAVRLFGHVERTDPAFRGVTQKLAKLKKELAESGAATQH